MTRSSTRGWNDECDDMCNRFGRYCTYVDTAGPRHGDGRRADRAQWSPPQRRGQVRNRAIPTHHCNTHCYEEQPAELPRVRRRAPGITSKLYTLCFMLRRPRRAQVRNQLLGPRPQRAAAGQANRHTRAARVINLPSATPTVGREQCFCVLCFGYVAIGYSSVFVFPVHFM